MLTFARKPQTTTTSEPASQPSDRVGVRSRRPPVWAQAAQGPLLAGLRVSEPGEALEREADRAAEVVLRTPEPTLQRDCDCPFGDENGLLQRQASSGAGANTAPASVIPGAGQPLPEAERRFFEPRFGADFRSVRVHTGPQADQSAQALNARAYTLGRDIVFARGQYAPGTVSGRRLLAHELTHVVQQRGEGAAAGTIQRAVSYDVITWDAGALGPPVPVNAGDPRLISIPPTGQIEITADVAVDGDPADPCTQQDIGTTQTAWVAWTIADYRGQTNADGSISVRHRSQMPMRDPTPAGGVWYDPANISTVASCGDVATIRHWDSPWHNVPKARNNGAVAGNPLNFLVRYRRGLHLVTYLTTQDELGNFRRQPLRFRYWNTIQDFAFTPQFPAPPANAAFLGMWPFTGGITVNIGSSGRGETADAPYYTTAGDTYNDHFNDAANWRVDERTTW